MRGQDLTNGSIKKLLWMLSWPIMLAVFFNTLYNLVDAYWVSKISSDAIAAVSISQITLWIMLSLSMGITIGSGVVMGMHIGAKHKEKAELVLGQSFVLSAIAGIFFTILALLLREQFLAWSGATGDIFSPALEYFTIIAAGAILIFILFSIVFSFSNQGDSLTIAKIFALSTGINIILDPILIFGYKFIPAMGISGAAWATLISELIAIVVGIQILRSPKMMTKFKFSNLRLGLGSVKKVLLIGVPASLTNVIGPLGMAALMSILSRYFNEAGVISLSLALRVEFMAFLPAVGFGFGGMALIAQNIGAKNIKRAMESYNLALLYAFGAALTLGILSFLFAEPLIRIFTDDAIVTEYTSLYLRTVPFTFGFFAVIMVITNAFQAIGKSWPGLGINILRLFILAIPLGLILISNMNSILGMWIAIMISNIATPLIGYFWFRHTISKVKEFPV